MAKIRCIRTENGIILPLQNIAAIAGEASSHYVWTNRNPAGNTAYKLTDRQYKALLNELEIIGDVI